MPCCPTKILGVAIYDMPGLTCPEPLDRFWQHARQWAPDPALHAAFRHYLIAHCQHQGSFYRRLPDVAARSGIAWAAHGSEAPHLADAGECLPDTAGAGYLGPAITPAYMSASRR